ncbi:MAG: YciI family protein [Pseudomonadota bacterium]
MFRNALDHKHRIGACVLIAAAFCGPAIAQGPPADIPPEIRERASQFLNKELYVYETTVAGDPKLVQENIGAHLDYQVQLEEEGIMFGAGPLYEEGSTSQFPKAGMIIVRAASFEEAKAIADADPMHTSGARTYTLRKWILNEGVVNFRVTYSGQRVEIE